MTDLDELTKLVVKFRDDRDWKQFNDPKNSATHLLLEATEVLELFAWMSEEESKNYPTINKSALADELSDVLSWVLVIAHDSNIDITKAFVDKLERNAQKYPIQKSKGKRTKYSELR